MNIKIDTTLCLLRHNIVSIGVQYCVQCDTTLYLLNKPCFSCFWDSYLLSL